MKKRYLFIALFLSAISLVATAQDVVVEHVEGPTVMCKGDLRDIVYAKQAQDGPLKVRQFGNDNTVVDYEDRITNLPQYLHDFIDDFTEAGRAVLNGGSNWLSDPTMAPAGSTSYYHPLKQVTGEVPFTFPRNASTDVVKQAAKDAVLGIVNAEYDILQSFLPYAFLCVNYDHPEFFWIGNAFNYGYSYSLDLSYSPSGGTGTASYTINLIFHLKSNGFDIRTSGVNTHDFRNPTNLANGVQIFNNQKKNILAQCTGSRYDKLLAAHEWLTHHNCYNYFYLQGYNQSQIGDTPWSAFSAMEGNNNQSSPVCESYARAFKVLCDEMDIPCILMMGVVLNQNGKKQSHMWNYVQMEDGKWYAIDVTWDDPTNSGGSYNQLVSGSESQDWFLLGSESPVKGGYSFIESHPEEWYDSYPSIGSYSWDLLAGPQLSPVAYTKSDFQKGDVNGDNGIDIADAVSVLNAMAGQGTTGNADVNGDNKIDIADFVSVLNIMAGQ